MSRRKRPDKKESPGALEIEARQRRARERDLEAEQRKIKAERAKVLHSFLHHHGSAGLVVIEGVSSDVVARFREGFEIELDERLLLMPADGNIQGEEQGSGFAQATLKAIKAHRETHGSTGVLGFEDIDFTGQSGRGTPQVAEHIAQILRDGRQKPRDELAVVAFGSGYVEDMPSSHFYDRTLDRGIVGELQIVLGLDAYGEPKPVLDPLIHSGLHRPDIQFRPLRDTDPGPGMDTLG